MIGAQSQKGWLHIKGCLSNYHVVSWAVNHRNLSQRWQKGSKILVCRADWGDLRQKSKEVTILSCHTQNRSVLREAHLRNSSSTLGNLEPLTNLLWPVWGWVELNDTVLSNCNLLLVSTYSECVDRRAASNIDGEFFLSEWFLLNRHESDNALFESNNKVILAEPIVEKCFAIVSLEGDHKALGRRGIYNGHLFLPDDACHNLFVGVSWWAPLNLSRLSLHDERILHCVTRLIWNGQELILWAGDQKTLRVPVTMSDLLSVLRDARNLPLTLPVVEDEWTLFRTDAKDRVSVGPANPRSLVLIRSELNILELS